MNKILIRGKRGFGKFAIVDNNDFGWLDKANWWLSKDGYAYTTFERSNLMMHRMLLRVSRSEQVDHINHDKLDNRRKNLRIVSSQQNNFNRLKRSDSKSKFKGVNIVSANKFRAMIKTKDYKWQKTFETELDAAKAYDLKAKELFGEYTSLNFN